MRKIDRKEIFSWFGILLGCVILAVGYVLFINPYNIVPGGVYGLSIVLHNLFPDIKVGTFGYMFDIPLLIISVLMLGNKLGTKTCVAALTTPALINLFTVAGYPNDEAVRSLDPALLLSGMLDFSNQLVLPVIIGSLLIGLGCGIIVKCGATSGGSDIVGMILQKYAHIRFSRAILLVDGSVVLFGLVVFIFTNTGSNMAISLSLYSLIAIYLIARTIATVINGEKDDKLLFVISDQELLSLHKYIIEDLDRTATLIKSSGLYTRHDKEMLFLVVSYKEVQMIKNIIKKADPRAFVVVTDAYDTYGEGWKALPNEGEFSVE